MRYIKSTSEKDQDFAEHVITRLNSLGFKTKKAGLLFSLSFVPGVTINVRSTFFRRVDFVCHHNEVILYTREEIHNFPLYLKHIIKNVESIIKKDVIIKHGTEASFGGI